MDIMHQSPPAESRGVHPAPAPVILDPRSADFGQLAYTPGPYNQPGAEQYTMRNCGGPYTVEGGGA
ncbi:hypothetical protein [Kitasatospora sp. MBT63]|uniref:hypothetical protein n=1 Tax=Kitasatospora sp. MBT63 TaxID=1444768 RepID=UPI000A83AC7D|nr:hypothetical protein [Kitasatospora sp. MBT63]